MTTPEIAQRLVSLCRQSQWTAAQTELFSPDAISIEPIEKPPFPKETRGLLAIIEKGKIFSSQIEAVHSLQVSEPLVAGNAFSCTMSMDVTMKGQPRMQMAEVCLYEVREGKIVSERFFV